MKYSSIVLKYSFEVLYSFYFTFSPSYICWILLVTSYFAVTL